MTTTEERPCDVHVLVKKDETPRPVRYCPLCKAWICDSCFERYDWRGIAMMKKLFHRIYGKEYSSPSPSPPD